MRTLFPQLFFMVALMGLMLAAWGLLRTPDEIKPMLFPENASVGHRAAAVGSEWSGWAIGAR